MLSTLENGENLAIFFWFVQEKLTVQDNLWLLS